MTSEFSLAVHALVFLNHKGETLSSDILAENICTNPARVRRVLSRLKKAGLVQTKEGIDGGYHFCRDPRQLTLDQVAQALEVEFVGASWRSGDQDMDCMIASGMANIMDELYARLDYQCYESLKGVSIADIDRRIFGEGVQSA